MAGPSMMNVPYLPMMEIFKKSSIVDMMSLASTNSGFQEFLRSLKVDSTGFKVAIDEIGWTIQTTKREYCHYGYEPSHSKFFVCAYARLQRLFSTQEVNSFELSTKMAKSLSAYKSGLPKSCNILVVKSNIDADFDESSFYAHPVPEMMEEQEKSEEEERKSMDQLFDLINIKNALVLSAPIELLTEKIYNINYLAIKYSGWLTADHLPRLQNRVVYLENTMLTDQDMNTFLKNLKSGVVKNKLEVLVVSGSYEDPNWNSHVVCDGLEAERVSDEKVRRQNWIFSDSNVGILRDYLYEPFLANSVDLSDARDFICEDGTRCSILIKSKKLGLYIWNQQETNGRKRRMDGNESAPESKRIRVD